MENYENLYEFINTELPFITCIERKIAMNFSKDDAFFSGEPSLYVPNGDSFCVIGSRYNINYYNMYNIKNMEYTVVVHIYYSIKVYDNPSYNIVLPKFKIIKYNMFGKNMVVTNGSQIYQYFLKYLNTHVLMSCFAYFQQNK